MEKIRGAFLILLSLATILLVPQTVKAQPVGEYFDHIVTILMENEGYSEILTSCNGGSPNYLTSLACQYASAAGTCSSDSSCSSGGYTATSHYSEGNYITLIGGYDYGHTDDGYCCWGISGSNTNIIDLLEGQGLTWKAWVEDATGSGCPNSSFSNGGFQPPRKGDHFAFLTFGDIDTSARCSNFATTTSSSSDAEFLSSLTPSAPNYVWLTPNDCDNMHGNSACSNGCTSGGSTCIAKGNDYLQSLVPRILTSQEFLTTRSALFIVFDEGNAGCSPKPCEDTSTTPDYVYASWSGPVVKQGYVSSTSFSHDSYSKTIEANWGLNCLVTGHDCSASTNAMTDVFKTGTFDSTWYYQPCAGTSGTSGTVTPLSNNILQTSQTTTDGSDNSPGYCVAQKGSFPWGSVHGSISPLASITFNGTLEQAILGATPNRYHLYIGLYYQLSGGSQHCDGGPDSGSSLCYSGKALFGSANNTAKNYDWLDTQVRVEVINGVVTPIARQDTYDPGNSFGWDTPIAMSAVGQSFSMTNYNLAINARKALNAWSLSEGITATLAGVEVGTEGFHVQPVISTWLRFTFTSPTNPQLSQTNLSQACNLADVQSDGNGIGGRDGKIDILDVAFVAYEFDSALLPVPKANNGGHAYSALADVQSIGIVNIVDVATVTHFFGQTC